MTKGLGKLDRAKNAARIVDLSRRAAGISKDQTLGGLAIDTENPALRYRPDEGPDLGGTIGAINSLAAEGDPWEITRGYD